MRAALYLRASTLKQSEEGYSLDYQRDKLQDYAKAKDWEIVEEYVDAGESGRTTNRPAFNRMTEDARKNKFETVLVYKLDRFSRSLQDLLNVINIMQRHGVFVWSVTQSYDDRTPEGRLMRNMLGSFAQFESEMIGARVKDGMARRAREGDWNTAPPYGYRMEGKLIQVPHEVAVVKGIYKKYLEGKTMNEIADDYNDCNIPTKRNGRWNPNTVRRVLTNPIYTGRLRYKGDIIETDSPQIISEEDFERVQALCRERRRKNSSKNES
ncbi:MAG: recombinase family protein [Thermoplasmata archaeon]|nr:recombinase family protein [Thermoplasmata archaeon]